MILLAGTVSAATITVNSLSDELLPGTGLCSLRGAVDAVNTGAAGAATPKNGCTPSGNYGMDDTILFDDSSAIQGGTVQFTATIVISKPLTIKGPTSAATTPANRITLQGGNYGSDFRLLDVDNATSPLTIEDLILIEAFLDDRQDFDGSGGALRSNGSDVTIRRCEFSGNTATSQGGAVFTTGKITIEDSRFSDNQVLEITPYYSDYAGGGAIYVLGDAVIRRSSFVRNYVYSSQNSGGGAIFAGWDNSWANTDSFLTITDSTFTDNFAGEGAGGAINAYIAGAVSRSVFTGNRANFSGGALRLGSGDEKSVIDHCDFTSNEAGDTGGAIEAGDVIIRASTFKNNHAEGEGGAAFISSASVDASTFIGNTTSHSGGAIDAQGVVNLSASTFIGNEAMVRGGAIISVGASLTVRHLTLVNNRAPSGAAIEFSGTHSSPGKADIANSLILGDDSVTAPLCAFETSSTPLTGGGNLGWRNGAADNSCGNNIAFSATSLGEIVELLPANNGGPTETLMLPAGSPAINAGNAVLSKALDATGAWVAAVTDQRGLPRPIGTVPDIGALEREIATITIASNVFDPAIAGGTLPTVGLNCGAATVGGSYPNFTVSTGTSCTVTASGAVAPPGDYSFGAVTFGGTGVNASTGAFIVPPGGIGDVTVTTGLIAVSAVITVNSLSDVLVPGPGLCSLRGAVDAVNTGVAGTATPKNGCIPSGNYGANDIVLFEDSPAIHGGIVPFSTVNGGTIVIKKPLRLKGPASATTTSANRVTLKGGGSGSDFRLLDVDNDTSPLFIEDLILTEAFLDDRQDFDGSGGALRSNGSDVTIRRCEFSGNQANAQGGALFTTGRVTIEGSHFSDNQVKKITAYGNLNYAGGGAIYALGDTVVRGSTFARNDVTNSYILGGGAIIVGLDNSGAPNNSFLTVTDSTFTNNRVRDGWGGSSGMGGAILNFGTSASISRSTFSGNTSGWSSGALYSQEGSIDHCVFENNTARGSGGGAIFGGPIVVRTSTFRNNTSTHGGAINFSGGSIDASMFIGNTSSHAGGAVAAEDYQNNNISNSTFIGNTANAKGGAIYGSSLTARHLTLLNNYAPSGTAIYIMDYMGDEEVDIANSLILGDASVTTPHCVVENGSITITGGGNLGWRNGAADSSCGNNIAFSATSLSEIIDLLPDDNGGPTQTLMLPTGSPALNAGNATLSKALDAAGVWVAAVEDQRGFSRPIGTAPDIGALEKEAATIMPASLSPGTVGTAYGLVSFSATGATGFAIDDSAPPSGTLAGLPPGMQLSSSGTLSGTPTVAGVYSFIVKAMDDSNATIAGRRYILTITAGGPAPTDQPVTVSSNVFAPAIAGGTKPTVGLNCGAATVGGSYPNFTVPTGASCTVTTSSAVAPSGYLLGTVTFGGTGVDPVAGTFTVPASGITDITVTTGLIGDLQQVTATSVFNPAISGGTPPEVVLVCSPAATLITAGEWEAPTGASCTVSIGSGAAPSGYRLGTTSFTIDGNAGTTFTIPASGATVIEATTALSLATVHVLNDTGQTLCFNGTTDLVPCSDANNGDGSTYPRQDPRFGRDAAFVAGALAKTGAGAAAFDFNKICNDGSDCSAQTAPGNNPTDWGCTRDNVTGLLWSMKDEGAMPWADATSTAAGSPIADANAVQRCGVANWRVPSPKELFSIAHLGTHSPAVDTDYFPSIQVAYYWSDAEAISDPTRAWAINFQSGYFYQPSLKTDPASLFLVSGSRIEPVFSFDAAAGLVTDATTNLMWDRCAWGGSGDNCATGSTQNVNWQSALQIVVTANANAHKGYRDWRLPNAKELNSMLDYRRTSGTLIDDTSGPLGFDTLWSNTTYSFPGYAGFVWYIHRGSGLTNLFQTIYHHSVLLVRGGDVYDALAWNVDAHITPSTTDAQIDFANAPTIEGDVYWIVLPADDPAPSFVDLETPANQLAVCAQCVVPVTATPLTAASPYVLYYFTKDIGGNYGTLQSKPFTTLGSSGDPAIIVSSNVFAPAVLGGTPPTVDVTCTPVATVVTAGSSWTVPTGASCTVTASGAVAPVGYSLGTTSFGGTGVNASTGAFTVPAGGITDITVTTGLIALPPPSYTVTFDATNSDFYFGSAAMSGGTLPNVVLDCSPAATGTGPWSVSSGADCTLSLETSAEVLPSGYVASGVTYVLDGVDLADDAFTISAAHTVTIKRLLAVASTDQPITVISNVFAPAIAGGTKPTVGLNCGAATVGGSYPNFTVPTGASCTVTTSSAVAPVGYSLGTTSFGGTGVNASTGEFIVPAGGIDDITVTTGLTLLPPPSYTVTFDAAGSDFYFGSATMSGGTLPEVVLTCTPAATGTGPWNVSSGASCTLALETSAEVLPSGYAASGVTYVLDGADLIGDAFTVSAAHTVAIKRLLAAASQPITISSNVFAPAIAGGTPPTVGLNCGAITVSGSYPNFTVPTGASCTVTASGAVAPLGYSLGTVTFGGTGVNASTGEFTVPAGGIDDVTVTTGLTAEPQAISHIEMDSIFVDSSGNPLSGGMLPTVVLNCMGMTGAHPTWTAPTGAACTLSLDMSGATLPPGYTAGNARFLLNGTALAGNGFAVLAGNNNISFQHMLLNSANGVPIPALDGKSLALLVLLLGACGIVLRRRGAILK